MRVVSAYIGVSQGYLEGFSYNGLEEFYPVYCGLEIDPYSYSGNTTRARFISVLRESPPHIQAQILRGLVEKIPAPTAAGPNTMTLDEVQALIARLEGLPVPDRVPEDASDVVRLALNDARVLIDSGNPVGAVDRVHTAMHGYLRDLCDQSQIQYQPTDSIARLLRVLREGHPTLTAIEAGELISRVLTSMGTAMDAINQIRNTQSLAHPNDNLIGDPEALLVINAARTILHYTEARLG